MPLLRRLLILSVVTLAACSQDKTNAEQGACHSNGDCNASLVCFANKCLTPAEYAAVAGGTTGATAGATAGGTTGSSSGGSTGTVTPTMAAVRLAHLAPDAPAVDFCFAASGSAFSGAAAIGSTGVSYGHVSDYVAVPSGSVKVRVVAAGSGR